MVSLPDELDVIRCQHSQLNGDEETYIRHLTCRDICKAATNSVFSTAGLFLLNVGYILIGAWIFPLLEQHNEKMACYSRETNYLRAENASLTLMMEIARRAASGELQKDGGFDFMREDYNLVLQAFSLSVLAAGHNITRNCSMMGEPGGPHYEWSFQGALTFAMTVTTTIGYGVIAPKTFWGRIVCVVYALLGIPLMVLFLTKVGELMAKIFRFTYNVICCCGCCYSKTRSKAIKKETSFAMHVLVHDSRKAASADFYNISTDESDDADEDGDDNSDNEEITVPLTISITVLIVFTTFGAALFGLWEKWPFVDAIYFCFVTYSTIGFGDIVPGTTNLDSTESAALLVGAGIYQVVGMATLSMCFQLMQDEIVAKIKWLAEKCGIHKKKEKGDN